MENQEGKDALVDQGRNGWKMLMKILKGRELDVGEGVFKIGKVGLLLFGRLWSCKDHK